MMADEAGGGGEAIGVKGGGEGAEAFHEGVSGGVEELVGDAEDVAVADGAEVVPVALLDDAGEGDAVARAAPRKDQRVGVGGRDFFRRGVCAGFAEVLAPGCGDQLGDPALGADQRLAPLLAIDGGVREGVGKCAGGGKFGFAGGDEALAGSGGEGKGREEADVFEDVGQGVRREGQDREAGFQDRRKGFHTVGDRSNDEVGLAGGDLGGVGCPGVVEDGEAEAGELGHGFDAVFGEAAESVEAAEGGDRQGDGGLEGDDAHCGFMVAQGGRSRLLFPHSSREVLRDEWATRRRLRSET